MGLNQEEKCIVDYALKGYKNIDIAEEMGYCESTIKKRLSLIYKKLNIKNRVDLFRIVIDGKFL